MKIAVYTIFKNEKQFAERWMKSAIDADFILAVDTGSTDGTAEKLFEAYEETNPQGPRKFGIDRCNIIPWRFDEARNFSLHLLPADVDWCICLDMDEVLTPGWRKKLEKLVAENPAATRLRYNYVWSWNKDGTPGLTYHADKIHRRDSGRWVGPVHEVLVRDKRHGPEIMAFTNETWIEHHPDNTKPRSQYFPLLNLAVLEEPHNDRQAHYYGRELFFHAKYTEAITELKRHLSLPSAKWGEERAASCRYIGDSFWALGETGVAIDWFERSLEEANTREGHVKLAQAYRALGWWNDCREACLKALAFKERPNGYLNDPLTWSDWPNRMLQEAEEKLASGNLPTA